MEPLIEISPLQHQRLHYKPRLPPILDTISHLKAAPTESFECDNELATLFHHTRKLFTVRFEKAQQPLHGKGLRVGVVFSGGQAPGGNNVVAGIYDGLLSIPGTSSLIGFLGGPSGLIEGRSKELTATLLAKYRNLGGFDLLGSDRTKFEPPTQSQVLKNVQALNLDGLVIIGGDDSNTNAAFLAEFFLTQGAKTRVIGVPKTIDGDLKSQQIEASFGFDTATKMYAEIIGNLARDTLSAKKYYFFIKLMGRTASSITLECALQTHPNFALIGEEILAEGKTLSEVVNQLADLICERAKVSKPYGIILIPEGILEFIPDCQNLIKELNALTERSLEKVEESLSPNAKACFQLLPPMIRQQLLLDRDPHGNLQVSKIETERLLIEMVKNELQNRKDFDPKKFNPQPLFCGYEGRSCEPSNFDANYCYALGQTAVALINNGLTGYMAAIKGLASSIENWEPLGVPLISLMGFEERKGKRKAVIRKALVDLNGNPFAILKKYRSSWALNDEYRYPGAIQYFGPAEVTERITYTLALENVK